MKNSLVAIASCLLAVNSWAQNLAGVTATDWKIFYNVGAANAQTSLAISNAGSNCISGILTLPASATKDDAKEFYNLIMVSKITGMKINVWYSNPENTCSVTSFGP